VITHPSADVLLLPGFPCPSFLARRAAARIVELVPGARCISVDWPGVGESAAGQDGIGGVRYGVEYSVAAVRAVADECGIGRAGGQPLVVVAHGYLGTLVGAEAAAALGAAAAVFLAPVVGAGREAVRLPAPLRRLRNPLVGPLLTGNPAHMADAVFASATPYGINEADMMVSVHHTCSRAAPGLPRARQR
jgi:pimeloyl-ACP methyl ester carboxylesterase